MAINEADVTAAYRLLLGRNPENALAVQSKTEMASLEHLLRSFLESPEYSDRMRGNRFWHYDACFNALELASKFEDKSRSEADGVFVSYFGVKIPEHAVPPHLRNSLPKVEINPFPNNWHADIAEFGAVARAVESSREDFHMLELGCGWGLWLNLAGKMAKQKHLRLGLIGVEADSGYVAMAQDALARNGFLETEYTIHEGIVAPEHGSACFPVRGAEEQSWGNEPLFGLSEDEINELVKSGKYRRLNNITFDDLVAPDTALDLIHIDIQGGEMEFVKANLHELTKNVRYLVIGTHSREIEGTLLSMLSAAGWVMELDRPCIYNLDGAKQTLVVDGVHCWKNGAF